MAEALRLETGIAVKNTVALARERWEGWTVAGADPQDLSPRPFTDLSPRLLWALAGELIAVIALFASGSVSPALVDTLQLFLRF